MTIAIPPGLIEATRLREGVAGNDWLNGLPAVVEGACRRWRCTVDGDARHGGVALIVPVDHPSGPSVLKVSFPHPGNLGEAAALRTLAGRGAVELREVDETGLILLLERARSESLGDLVSRGDMSVDEAVEVCGRLAGRLAVEPDRATTRLADTVPGWMAQLEDQVQAVADHGLAATVLDRARATIEQLAADETPTLLHGDLHVGNVLRADREPWLTIDPKGWTGTAAFDAFTVALTGAEQLRRDGDAHAAIVRRVVRFSSVARCDAGLALACCQARAVSAYLYQRRLGGEWFDLQILRWMAERLA